MEELIKQLEKRVKNIVHHYEQIRLAHQKLNKIQASTADINCHLLDKQQQAVKQVQALIIHLKNLGVTHE